MIKQESDNKPELLIPVGNIESFYSALESGADAIYFGLKNFNARNRAMNFTPWQAAAMVKEAKKKNIRSYITLNTVVRNFEIITLIDTLNQIQQIRPDALIIQDLGVLYIINKYFPDLKIHASTQMAVHNSVGMKYSSNKKIERVVLARELTMMEIEEITRKTDIETEIFVHGALCYSFSGMCLFSSFLGGNSANRGLCTQPCRRIYSQKEGDKRKTSYSFSLKDNQLIDYLKEFKNLNITSLKVEGRLKPADYISGVSKAYRMAIDNPEKMEEAKSLLQYDCGREKTSYFTGRDVYNSITQSATAGILIGKVSKSENNVISFTSNFKIEEGSRLRFRNPQNDKQVDIKAEIVSEEGLNYSVTADSKEIKQTYEVYIAGYKIKLPQKINTDNIQIKEHYPSPKTKQINDSLRFKGNPQQKELFLRLDNTGWIDKINFKDFQGVILQLTRKEWLVFNADVPAIKKNKEKIFVELPKFIPEKKISFYKAIALKLFNAGFTSFFISHISQLMILPKGSKIYSNENVYAFNDAAIKFLKDEGIKNFIYPLETDIANLGKGSDRNGIIPLFYFPHLFYSRMPVKLSKDKTFSDSTGQKYFKHIKDGMTIITPDKPVSIIQYREKIERYGFGRFLIDLSFISPDDEMLFSTLKSFNNSESIKESSIFNFKRELK